jgi:hypothetical protein
MKLTTYGAGAFAEIVGPNLEFANLNLQTDSSRNGKLIFTKRTPQRLEGIFYFDAYRETGAPIVHITEGRFSLIP